MAIPHRTKVKHVFGVVKSFSNVEKRDNEGMKNRQKNEYDVCVGKPLYG